MSTAENFYADTQRYVERLLAESPTQATFLGDHRYDERLGDFSAAGIERQRALWHEALDQFCAYDTQAWDVDAQIDQTLMVQMVKSQLRAIEKLRLLQRDPGMAPGEGLGGVYLLIMRNYAPLDVRMRAILGRLREVPRVLDEGRALLDIPAVPRVWAEVALESAQQGVGLLAGFVPALAEATPELKDEVLPAARAAGAAMQAYAAWVESEVLPRAAGDFAVGKEIFDELLHEDHLVDYEAGELIATGWRLYEDTQRQMRTLAEQIDAHKSVKQILEESKRDHPAAGELLDTYRRAMDACRQFVVDRQIATLPPNESLRVEPTPEFMRPVIPYAAYQMPGFLEDLQEGVFIVTPVEAGASPEEAEAKLRGHPNADIPVTAAHEAYPGHHLQLTCANVNGSLPRKLGGMLSSLFVEGWAFYCEELMEQLGFIPLPVQRLGRLQAQLWRASRIIIDGSLHTGKMTVGEAIDFLVQRAGLEPGDAKAEVRRYTQSPTQPQCYLMGKLQILDIVAEYKRRYPQAGMREMHDAILSCGSLPPRLMRKRLFGDA